MCDPVTAIAAGVGAMSSGMQASAANKQASRNYQHQLKVRERKWMGERSLYSTKLVQHDQEVDLANIAAQRAYTKTQLSLNNAQALAILQNQEDWKKMLVNEGTAQVSAASRGIRGKSVARQLVMNKGAFGMTQAMRTRGLTMAQYEAKYANESVNRQLKAGLNQSFGKVAIEPIPDVAPPKPVYQNAMLSAILGGAQAGLSAYKPKGDTKALSGNISTKDAYTGDVGGLYDFGGGIDPGFADSLPSDFFNYKGGDTGFRVPTGSYGQPNPAIPFTDPGVW